MAYTIRTEMPSGAQSKGFSREREEDARKVFRSVADQMAAFKIKGSATLLLKDDVEIEREKAAE